MARFEGIRRGFGSIGAMSRCVRLALSIGILLGAVEPVDAWLVPGHRRVTIEAIGRLPAAVPAFFREGAAVASYLRGLAP